MIYKYRPRKVGQTIAFVGMLYADLLLKGETSIISNKPDEAKIKRYKEMLLKSYGMDVSYKEMYHTSLKHRYLQDFDEFEPHGIEHYNETKFVGYKLKIEGVKQ